MARVRYVAIQNIGSESSAGVVYVSGATTYRLKFARDRPTAAGSRHIDGDSRTNANHNGLERQWPRSQISEETSKPNIFTHLA
jgi:hypothetical protein